MIYRKEKEDQINSANSRAGVYKFGQFLHHAPTSNQPPASRLPSTTKRNALPKPHPPTPRTPLLIPATSNYSRPPSRSFTAQSSGATSVGGQAGHTPTSESLPSSDKFFINVPPRSPVIGERGSRRPAPMSYLGNRGGRPQQQSCKAAQVMSSPSVALADTMYNMNIQTPTRPSTHAKPQGQVAPVAPHQSATLETRRGGSSEPAMGPGGDAQPNPISSEDQLPCQGDIEMSGSSLEMMEANPQEDMQNVQEYPLTPKCSQDRDRTEGPKTPKTPGDTFDLGSFKDFGKSKSPGFSYSCRAMFGDSADQNQAEQTSNNNFQENPFFSSFFGASSKFTDQQPSQSPGDMFGGGGNTPATSNTNQDAGAMSMFGDSPSSTQPNQTRQEPESMGFSFNFGSSSPSQTPAGGDSESGGGRSGGFCLF
ncbi:flocculation protein FLO11-like [Lytechinus variegatus]|uniref:flocculation protein FLO11-like n=1 Tax=Lytechinus variegatus TaxID=7654 RepID=UPI001BB228D3|nr:flocculation protein FLO11-like [Lytechinus variegatus]